MILRRYISQQIALTSILVLGFLLFLLLGGRLIRYFGMAAEGQLDVGVLFTIISYNIPFLLELILPLSFFIALMLVFGRLYVDNEMSVINSCGVSRGRLAGLTTPLIIIVFIIEAWLSIVGKPWGLRHSETIWQEQGVKSAFDLIRSGKFISSGDYHLYVGSIDEKKRHLQDVILIQTNSKKHQTEANNTTGEKKQTTKQKKALTNSVEQETTDLSQLSGLSELPELPKLPKQLHHKDSIILAKYAKQVETTDTSIAQLDLFNGRRYEIGANSQKYNQISFQRYRLTLTPAKKDEFNEFNVATQSIDTVWQSAIRHNPVSQAELGYRLALPWLIILAIMLATPLAQVRPRQGRWLKLVPSILLFVGVAVSIISLKDPIAKERISVWAYAWLLLALTLVALYLNWAGYIHQQVRFALLNQRKQKELS